MHATTGVTRRAMIWTITMVMALSIAGCGSEAKERKTFIDFLQTRIIDKPGIHVPRLTPAEEKSFGDYSKHFAVITDFNSGMDTRVAAPMRDVLGKGMPRSMPDLLARRADLAKIRETSALLRTNLDVELAKALAERGTLAQPDDLKVVYDKAFERTVNGPATTIRAFLPAVEDTLASAEKLADFLDAHKEQIKFRGNLLEVSDPKLLAEANALMSQMNARSNEVMGAQRKLNTLVTGR